MKRFSLLFGLFLMSCSAWAKPVNINAASVQQLADALSGIGVKKAQAIVDFRDAHGEFKLVAELTQVKGIGPALLDKIKQDVLLKD